MWEKLNELRQEFLNTPELNTKTYKNYLVQRLLYETLKLGGNPLPEQDFAEIITTGKHPRSTDRTKAYDIWQA